MERVFLNDSRVLFEVVNPVGFGKLGAVCKHDKFEKISGLKILKRVAKKI